MRRILLCLLTALQAAVPSLYHGHLHGAPLGDDPENAVGSRRWIPPHIHTHHLPFWPFEDDEDHHPDDHPEGVPPGGHVNPASRTASSFDLGGPCPLSPITALTGAVPIYPVAPCPVALWPPAAGPPGKQPPLYLLTLSLLI